MEVHRTSCESETVELGRRLGRDLQAPRLVLLTGDLGAGKTALVRGLVQGLEPRGPEPPVCSPSFTLVNEYETRRGTVYHVDLYRLEGERQRASIGLEEILSRPAFVIVEWAEKLGQGFENALRIDIRVDYESRHREIRIFR